MIHVRVKLRGWGAVEVRGRTYGFKFIKVIALSAVLGAAVRGVTNRKRGRTGDGRVDASVGSTHDRSGRSGQGVCGWLFEDVGLWAHYALISLLGSTSYLAQDGSDRYSS